MVLDAGAGAAGPARHPGHDRRPAADLLRRGHELGREAVATAAGPVLAVAHSYGGLPVAAGGHGSDRLVLVAARMPEPGVPPASITPEWSDPAFQAAVVRAVTTHERAEAFDGEPGHGHPRLDRGLTESLAEVGLPGPGRPADAEVLPPTHPLQRGESVLGGARDAGRGGVPVVQEPGRVRAGCAARWPKRSRWRSHTRTRQERSAREHCVTLAVPPEDRAETHTSGADRAIDGGSRHPTHGAAALSAVSGHGLLEADASRAWSAHDRGSQAVDDAGNPSSVASLRGRRCSVRSKCLDRVAAGSAFGTG